MVFLAEESILHVVAIVSAILFITSVSGSDWPSGWYGLPEPRTGCPSVRYSSEWGSGWWYEDRRLSNQTTARVPQYSHLKGTFTQEVTKRYFCMKEEDNRLKKTWPDGQYCIYQGLLKPCPPGFVKGSIGWKNKDAPNKNHHPGDRSNSKFNLPSGVFASNTRINYCCRVDGSKENSISLPINRPFLLLAYNSSQCQSVKWARTTQEYLRYSVQEKMTFRGFHPFVDDNYTLTYCYYKSKPNLTVTSPNGIISRYLNQTSIHQERYTAWHIHPHSILPLQIVVLHFTRFIFHASNITSYLEVFDGPNESAAASLGRFSSTQSPLGRNLTSINQFFVVLNFDDRNGTYDLEFNYHIITNMTTVVTTLSSSQPHTSSESVTPSSPYSSPSSKTSQPHTSSESVTPSSPYSSPSSKTSQPHTSSESVTSSSPYTLPSSKTSQPHTSYDVTSSPTTTPGYLRYHDNGGKSKLLLSILLPIGGLVIVLLVLTVVLLKRRRRRRRYSRMDVSIYDSEQELDDDMDGYFEEIQLSPVCSLLQLTSQPIEESRTISNQASNESLPSEQEQFNGQQHDVPLETECHNIDPSASTSQTNQNESDPVPSLSYYILGNDFNANDSEETESKEAESIELVTLLKENQNELVLQKSHQEKDTKIKATQC